MPRRHLRFLPRGVLLVSVVASMGAVQQTPNFVVYAPTPQIAQQVGQYAELYRREKAREWLGEEMPPWSQPCPLYVKVTMDGPTGATTFTFGPGTVLGMKMEIQGPLDRLLSSVLPHEITHTVLAHYFRCPVPRWADEGGSVLSEDDLERERHDRLTRQILNQGRQIPLRRLLSLKEYPRGEVHCLYAQGYSVTDYLVKRGNRQTFLQFIAYAMHHGWDRAVQAYYGHRNIEELEGAWLTYLRDMRRQPNDIIARDQPRTAGEPRKAGDRPANGTVVRLTSPPAPPLDPDPVVRGARPGPEQTGQRFDDRYGIPAHAGIPANPGVPAHPGVAANPLPGPAGWQPAPAGQHPPAAPHLPQGQRPPQVFPVPAETSGPPPLPHESSNPYGRVILLPPQFDPPPPPSLPAGFPR